MSAETKLMSSIPFVEHYSVLFRADRVYVRNKRGCYGKMITTGWCDVVRGNVCLVLGLWMSLLLICISHLYSDTFPTFFFCITADPEVFYSPYINPQKLANCYNWLLIFIHLELQRMLGNLITYVRATINIPSPVSE